MRRALADAARPVLAPLGLKQKGHSRHWIGDERCWIVLVELVPDGEVCAKVGAQFLWCAEGHLLFDYGRRIAGLAPDELARATAAEVAAVRRKFMSPAKIARHFAAAPSDEPWPLYHRAVATALAGEIDAATSLFARLAAKPATRDWQTNMQADAAALARHLPDLGDFRAAVAAVVTRARALLGLPADAACLD
jgi:hypothetical protein